MVSQTICEASASFLPGVGKCLVSKAGAIRGFLWRQQQINVALEHKTLSALCDGG